MKWMNDRMVIIHCNHCDHGWRPGGEFDWCEMCDGTAWRFYHFKSGKFFPNSERGANEIAAWEKRHLP